MEFIQFLRVLYRRKLLLIIIPVITVIVTYLLVRNLPNTYLSKSRLSTGLTDATNSLISQSQSEAEINQQFTNLIQQMYDFTRDDKLQIFAIPLAEYGIQLPDLINKDNLFNGFVS